jgi:purine-binding chemotaxis protein CheW
MSNAVASAGAEAIDVAAWTCATNTVASTDPMQFISFAIGDDYYGVDIMAVREIKGCSEINQLPDQPDYVRGVINLRGVIVPVVDLRCRFGQGVTETSPLHVFIIVQIGDKLVGLLADRVSDIISAERGEIKPVPNVSRETGGEFLFGIAAIEKQLIALIDLPRLIDSAVLTAQRTV